MPYSDKQAQQTRSIYADFTLQYIGIGAVFCLLYQHLTTPYILRVPNTTAGHTLSLQTLIVWCLLDEMKPNDMNYTLLSTWHAIWQQPEGRCVQQQILSGLHTTSRAARFPQCRLQAIQYWHQMSSYMQPMSFRSQHMTWNCRLSEEVNPELMHYCHLMSYRSQLRHNS